MITLLVFIIVVAWRTRRCAVFPFTRGAAWVYCSNENGTKIPGPMQTTRLPFSFFFLSFSEWKLFPCVAPSPIGCVARIYARLAWNYEALIIQEPMPIVAGRRELGSCVCLYKCACVRPCNAHTSFWNGIYYHYNKKRNVRAEASVLCDEYAANIGKNHNKLFFSVSASGALLSRSFAVGLGRTKWRKVENLVRAVISCNLFRCQLDLCILCMCVCFEHKHHQHPASIVRQAIQNYLLVSLANVRPSTASMSRFPFIPIPLITFTNRPLRIRYWERLALFHIPCRRIIEAPAPLSGAHEMCLLCVANNNCGLLVRQKQLVYGQHQICPLSGGILIKSETENRQIPLTDHYRGWLNSPLWGSVGCLHTMQQ